MELLRLSGQAPQPLLGRFAPCRGSTPRALVGSWLNALTRDRPQAELARGLGVNRNTVARWLAGTTEPRLPQLLAFLDITTQRALDFLAEVAPPESLPSERLRGIVAESKAPTRVVLATIGLVPLGSAPRH